eukprot:9240128-Ditylum_brightwellii.AAC.1
MMKVDGFIQPHSQYNTNALFCRHLHQLVKASSPSSSESMIINAEEEKEEEALLSILQHAMKTETITSFEILDKIVQTGAVGTRVLVHHHDDTTTTTKATDIFVKQINASQFSGKTFTEMRRYLLYARTEVRFYGDILPHLYDQKILNADAGDSIMAPRCYYASLNLDGLMDDLEHVLDSPNDEKKDLVMKEEDLAGKGGILVLESIGAKESCRAKQDENDGRGSKYFQDSPLTLSQSSQCLSAVAKLHAAAWQDETLLQNVEQRLSKGAHHLRMRNPKELEDIVDTWDNFMSDFLQQEAPDL